MAIEHGGNTNLPRGTGLLETVVAGVLRRFGGDHEGESETGEPATTPTDREVDHAADRIRPPEAHIVDALERGGGAMKQSAIVDSVEWSESTVSRKLSDLESHGAVSRYQIGREKLVYLPGHEPAAAESALAPAGAD